MSLKESRELERVLQGPEIHHSWETSYRTAENQKFYDQVFSYLADLLDAPAGATLLDAGCGICDYSLRLADHGFAITAVDFSEAALLDAEAHIRSRGKQDVIRLQRENLLSLSFPDASFDYVLCWGVLMHIPDVQQALSELGRVLKTGGTLIVSEGNRHSLEAVMLMRLKKMFGKQKEQIVETAAGREFWAEGAQGRLLSRQTDIGWLKAQLAGRGLRVEKHVAGQFTELYCRCTSPALQRLMHLFNRFWFASLRNPSLAFGNILIARKIQGGEERK